MKTKLFLTMLVVLITFTNCKKDKIKGCTDSNSLNYNSKAEENDNSCSYVSGSYAMTENCGSLDQFTITISGNGNAITINNLANQFDNISATRNGLSITLTPKQGILDRSGKYWDLDNGSGTISADGKNLTISYTVDDILYANVAGYLTCSANGVKL